jgi:predicted DsbA family dithiol-disulfide isomerase
MSELRGSEQGVHEVMSKTPEQQLRMAEYHLDDPRTVLHWYDFLCPFCYIGQHRTAILVRRGLDVVELPFQAHPDIPSAGIPAGPRSGPMYTMLEQEAREVGLSLNWPRHLSNTRRALTVAEWTRRHQPDAFSQLQHDLFRAHFVLGEDLGDSRVVDRYASEANIDLVVLNRALDDGSAEAVVSESETTGRKFGVQGTPAWLLAHRLVSGLQPAEEFKRLAEYVMLLPR